MCNCLFMINEKHFLQTLKTTDFNEIQFENR